MIEVLLHCNRALDINNILETPCAPVKSQYKNIDCRDLQITSIMQWLRNIWTHVDIHQPERLLEQTQPILNVSVQDKCLKKKAMMLENYNLHAIARGTARVNVNWIVLKFISGLSFKTKSYQHGNEWKKGKKSHDSVKLKT